MSSRFDYVPYDEESQKTYYYRIWAHATQGKYGNTSKSEQTQLLGRTS